MEEPITVAYKDSFSNKVTNKLKLMRGKQEFTNLTKRMIELIGHYTQLHRLYHFLVNRRGESLNKFLLQSRALDHGSFKPQDCSQVDRSSLIATSLMRCLLRGRGFDVRKSQCFVFVLGLKKGFILFVINRCQGFLLQGRDV